MNTTTSPTELPATHGSPSLVMIQQYLELGGLFNPEMMEHDKVRDMVMLCRDEIKRLRSELENIAKAKPSEWGEMSDQFQVWAQNRARHALANPEALSVSAR